MITQDHFLFRMNPSSLKTKQPTSYDHKIALQNLLSVTENYIKAGKDIIIEGALVSITDNDPTNIDDFVQLAGEYGYLIKIITLVADENVRKRRQKKRGCVLKPHIDKKLVNASKNQTVASYNYQLDTSKLTIKKSLEELEKIINK